MIPPLQIDLTTEARAVLAQAPEWPRALPRALRVALDLENELTVAHIVTARATGKGPFPPAEGRLGVVKSRYRRSVRPARAVVRDTEIWSAIGSNVRYAGAHEFGVDKKVQVAAHGAKNRMLDLLEVSGRTVARWESFGLRGKKTKVASGYVTVRTHERHMRMPERAPIRRGISDRLPHYRDALGTAIVGVFRAEPRA